MKNKKLVHHYQSAKIYRNYYKPSFNFLRLLKSVLSVFISGTSVTASSPHRHK